MTTYRLDRCANTRCRRALHLDWDADSCRCGAVITCETCDPNEACNECREAA